MFACMVRKKFCIKCVIKKIKTFLKERIKLFFNNKLQKHTCCIISIKLIKPNYIQFAEHLSRGRNPDFHQVLILTMWNPLKIPSYIRYTQMMIFIHPLLSLFLDWHALLEKSDEAKVDLQVSSYNEIHGQMTTEFSCCFFLC